MLCPSLNKGHLLPVCLTDHKVFRSDSSLILQMVKADAAVPLICSENMQLLGVPSVENYYFCVIQFRSKFQNQNLFNMSFHNVYMCNRPVPRNNQNSIYNITNSQESLW